MEKIVESPWASDSDPTPDQSNAYGTDRSSESECSFTSSVSDDEQHLEYSSGIPAGQSDHSPAAEQSGDAETASLPDPPLKRQRTDSEQDFETASHLDMPPSPSIPGKDSAQARKFQTQINFPRTKLTPFDPPIPKPHRLPPSSPPPRHRSRTTTSPDLPHALPVETALPPIPIGAVELLTFFPHHTQWPLAGLRLHRNHWTFLEIAAVALHARGNLSASTLHNRRATLRHQIRRNGREHFGDERFTLTFYQRRGLLESVGRYDAREYAPRSNIAVSGTKDGSLLACARGVVNWPQGEDCGILTQCVAMARDLEDPSLMVSEVARIAECCGFVLPKEAEGGRWDQCALERVGAIVKGYRLGRQVV